MATRYVDFVNGADANNGQGPDASHATNKPWKTLTKALGAAGISSGDTLYLSPAGPFRETVAVAMTSAVAETKVIGDYANAQGFKTSGGVLVAPGPIIVTGYTTNDKTAPSGTTLLNLAGRDFLTFQNIMFQSGAVAVVTATTTTSTDIKFTDCAFICGSTLNNQAIVVTGAFGVVLNWTIDRCVFRGGTSVNISVTLTSGVGTDWDANFQVQNCLFIGGSGGVQIVGSGASANKGGGVDIRNCTFLMGSRIVEIVGATISTSIPCTFNNNVILGGGTCLQANTLGQLTEDYNLIAGSTARSSVSVGTHSISDGSYAPLHHFGQERIWGSPLFKPTGEPMQGSPLLGFGNDGTQTATDLLALQRPAGAGNALPAAGAMERHNNWITDPSPIGTGATPIKITGPGDQAFLVPVPARAITISVVVKWDATYAGTKPQFQIDANPELGVVAETKTAVGSSGSNETLTLSAFTPSKAGRMVTVRVKSNDTNGAGVVQADSFSVTG